MADQVIEGRRDNQHIVVSLLMWPQGRQKGGVGG